MSRAQAHRIEDLQEQLWAARTQLAELTAEKRGEDRGRNVVAEQLAKDLRLGALREEHHRKNAAQAYGDLQRALGIVAAHILDSRATAGQTETAEMAELLVDELTTAGLPLKDAFIAVQTERADSSAKVSAAAASDAVVNAAPALAR
jgi:hypothetical protein